MLCLSYETNRKQLKIEKWNTYNYGASITSEV